MIKRLFQAEPCRRRRFLYGAQWAAAFFLIWAAGQCPAFAVQINRVQHGKVLFAAGEMERTYVLPYPVNPEQSLIVVSATSPDNGADDLAVKVAAYFNDSRTVRIVRLKGGFALEAAVSVAEFKKGVRVHRGVSGFAPDIHQKQIDLPKIDIKNTVVFLNPVASECEYSQRAYLYFLPQFFDTHTLTVKRTEAVLKADKAADKSAGKKGKVAELVSMPRAEVYWQVMEVTDGAKVQQGSAKLPNFSSDVSAYFSEAVANLDHSFIQFHWIAGQKTYGRTELVGLREDFSERSRVLFKRRQSTKETDTNLEIQWSLVELQASSHSVQRGLARFDSGTRENKIKIKKANASRALVLLHYAGSESKASDGKPAGARSFVSELTGDEELTIRRGKATMDMEVAWTLIEFAPLTLEAPRGGEVLRVGEPLELVWDYAADTLLKGKGPAGEQLVDVQVSFEGGRDLFPHILAHDLLVTAGNFKWLIPDTVNDKSVISRDVFVRVVMKGISDKNSDENRAPLEIKGVIKLITPQGGERWYVGETERKIEWEYKGRLGVLSIYYDRESSYGFDPFPRTQRIARVVPGKNGKGAFTWNPIPDLSLTRARIKVVSEADETVYSSSEKDFEIVPRIDLQISAKDAEAYDAGRFLDLKWATTGTIDFFSLYYQTDMYADWKLAKAKIPGVAAGNYSFRWLVPAEAESDTLRLKITKTSDLKVFDTGPDDLGGFITVRPWIQLKDPTENDIPVWRAGEKQVIEWDF